MAAITHASIQGLFQFSQAMGKGPRFVTGIRKAPAAYRIAPRCRMPSWNIPSIRCGVRSCVSSLGGSVDDFLVYGSWHSPHRSIRSLATPSSSD